MVTAVATPETSTRAVYGVVWNGHVHPLTDYDEYEEALAVARVMQGHVMVRYETRTPWEPV